MCTREVDGSTFGTSNFKKIELNMNIPSVYKYIYILSYNIISLPTALKLLSTFVVRLIVLLPRYCYT